MVKQQSSKLWMRVRFFLPVPFNWFYRRYKMKTTVSIILDLLLCILLIWNMFLDRSLTKRVDALQSWVEVLLGIRLSFKKNIDRYKAQQEKEMDEKDEN